MRYYGNIMTTTIWRLRCTVAVADIFYIFNSTVVDWTCFSFFFLRGGHELRWVNLQRKLNRKRARNGNKARGVLMRPPNFSAIHEKCTWTVVMFKGQAFWSCCALCPACGVVRNLHYEVNNMFFITPLIVWKCKEITATARSVLRLSPIYYWPRKILITYCDVNLDGVLVVWQDVLEVWHVVLTLVLKITQSYSLLPALVLQLTMKRYELEYVTYAIFWISHIRLFDVQIVHDSAWKARYFLHSALSDCL